MIINHLQQFNRPKSDRLLVCSQRCAEAIGDPKSNMSFYKDGKGMVCGPADWICERDGWELPWSADAVRLMPTPGHSPGGLCAAIGGHLFTGDTLLGNRRTPTHLPGGNAAALEQSIKLLLNEFDSKTLVYPGHGSCFVLGEADLRKVLGTGHPAPFTGMVPDPAMPGVDKAETVDNSNPVSDLA